MDFVQLFWKRTRGWPRPEESWGLDSLFGPDGWCRTCGTPLREQTGSLTLAPKGMRAPLGAWVPNWIYDTVCADTSIAADLGRFGLDMRAVAWAGAPPAEAVQLVVPTVGAAWFDEEALRERAIAKHGVAGASCGTCGTWRWMPLTVGALPPLTLDLSSVEADAIASPEWFGDGKQSYRQVLLRRDLAEILCAASPGDFAVRDAT